MNMGILRAAAKAYTQTGNTLHIHNNQSLKKK